MENETLVKDLLKEKKDILDSVKIIKSFGSDIKMFHNILQNHSRRIDEEIKERTTKAGFLWKHSILKAEKVARIAMKKMENRSGIIVPGIVNKFGVFLCYILPQFMKMYLAIWLFKKSSPEDKTGN